MTKKTVIAIAIALVGGLIIGRFAFQGQTLATATNSGQGVSNGSAKIAQESLILGTTTTFALQNTGSTDREIGAADVAVNGGTSTTTSFNLACATSTNAVSLNGNTNYVLNMGTTAVGGVYGTTTGAGLYMSSTSPGLLGTAGTATGTFSTSTTYTQIRDWPTQSWLVCQTTSADGYNSFNAGTGGFIKFPYATL